MALSTLRWRSNFASDTNEFYIVEIFDINYNNFPRGFSLGSKPVTLKWDGKGEDRFSPMIGSTAEVEFVIRTDTERLYWRAVFEEYQEQEVFLRIRTIPVDQDQQDVIIWSGWLLGDLSSEEQDEFPWLLKLKFTDSMALLKDHFFCDDETTDPITNYEDDNNSFMVYIMDCLKKINVGGDGAAFNDITPIGQNKPLRSVVKWGNSAISTASISYDALAKFGCRPRPFWDVNDAGQIKPKNCYDAIEMFCKVWGARFVFFNNQYWFIQVNYYFNSNFDVQNTAAVKYSYQYTWTYAAQSAAFENATNLDYEAKIRPSYFKTLNSLMGGKETYYPPIKRVISTYGRWMGINLLTTCPAANSTSNVDGWRGNIDMGESYELGTFEEDSELVFRFKWLTELTNGGVGYNCFQNIFQANYPPGGADYGYAGTSWPNPLLVPGSAYPEVRFTLQLTDINTGDIYAVAGGVDANGQKTGSMGPNGAFTLYNWTNYLAYPTPTIILMGNWVSPANTNLFNWGPTLCDHNFILKLKTGGQNGIAGLPASAGGYSIQIHFFNVPGGASYNTTNYSSSSQFAVDSTFGGFVSVGNDMISEKKDNFDNGDPAGAGTGMYLDVKGLNTGTLGAEITFDPALVGGALYPSGLECGIFHIDGNGQYTGAPFTWVIDNNGAGASVVASTLEYETGALLFGDGRHAGSFGAIKYENAPAIWLDPDYEGWFKGTWAGSGDFITELLGKEIMMGQMNLTSKLDFTITRSTKVLWGGSVPRLSPLTRLDYRGKKLLPLRCAWNLLTDEWKGKWFEIKDWGDNMANNANIIGAGSGDIDGVPAGGSLQRRSINAGGSMADTKLTNTSALISAGATTEIPINSITLGGLEGAAINTTTETAVLKAGDRITLIADLSADLEERDGSSILMRNYSLLITADQKAGDTTLSVESFNPEWDIAAESCITFQKSQYLQKVLGVRDINVKELSQVPKCWYDISDDSTLTISAANLVSGITNKAVDGVDDLTYAGDASIYDIATMKNPSITFNGTSSYYTLGTGLTEIMDFDFWMVIHPDADWLTSNPYMTFFGHSNGHNFIRTQGAISNYQFKVGNVANNTGTLRAGIVAAQPQIIRFFRSVVAGAEGYDITDSVEINGIGSGDTYTLEVAATDGQFSRIGARNNLAETSFLDGNIGEMLMYDEKLTTNNALQILNYLKNKWL